MTSVALFGAYVQEKKMTQLCHTLLFKTCTSIYTSYFFLTCLSAIRRKEIILSATKFYQCSKAPEHQGKLDQNLEALRLTT